MDEFDNILSKIGYEAALMQLAEEASELSQAASKMARYIHGTNPVSPSLDENKLRNMLVEEFSDTCLSAHICGINVDNDLIDKKAKRWINRINGDNTVTTEQTVYYTVPRWLMFDSSSI